MWLRVFLEPLVDQRIFGYCCSQLSCGLGCATWCDVANFESTYKFVQGILMPVHWGTRAARLEHCIPFLQQITIHTFYSSNRIYCSNVKSNRSNLGAVLCFSTLLLHPFKPSLQILSWCRRQDSLSCLPTNQFCIKLFELAMLVVLSLCEPVNPPALQV